MPDISIQQVSKDFNYTLGTLRVYHTDRRLPMIKKFRRLFVTEETYNNLQSLHRDGIPFARYFEVYRKQYGGLGGTDNDYELPEYLVLTKPDKGSKSELIAELQETIAEQERELERQEKRLKNYTLEILELKEQIKALELKYRLKCNELLEMIPPIILTKDPLSRADNIEGPEEFFGGKEEYARLNKEYDKGEEERIAILLEKNLREQNKLK